MKDKYQEIRSSLPFQLLLYLDAWYFTSFIIVEVLLYIYKVCILPYPAGNIIAELLLLVLLAGLETIRNFLGQKGNKTEEPLGVFLLVALSVPAILGTLYFLLWQTYVLRLEVILASIQLTFLGLQLIFASLCIITFSRSRE